MTFCSVNWYAAEKNPQKIASTCHNNLVGATSELLAGSVSEDLLYCLKLAWGTQTVLHQQKVLYPRRKAHNEKLEGKKCKKHTRCF